MRLSSSAPITIPSFEQDDRMAPLMQSLSPSPPSHLSPRSLGSLGSPPSQSASPTTLAAASFALALATGSVIKGEEDAPLMNRNADIVRLNGAELTKASSNLPPWESFFKDPIAIWVHNMFEEKEILAVLQGLTKRQILELTSDSLINRGLNNPFQLANVMWIVGKVKDTPQYDEFIKTKP